MGRKGIARSIIIRDRRQVSSDRVIVFCHEKPIFVVIAPEMTGTRLNSPLANAALGVCVSMVPSRNG